MLGFNQFSLKPPKNRNPKPTGLGFIFKKTGFFAILFRTRPFTTQEKHDPEVPGIKSKLQNCQSFDEVLSLLATACCMTASDAVGHHDGT